MFFCAISGEPPQEPVVSTKSKKVYERRLILKYIKENGTDPITGDKLEESDLISIEASRFTFDASAVNVSSLIRLYRSRNSSAAPTYPYVNPSTSSYPSKRVGCSCS